MILLPKLEVVKFVKVQRDRLRFTSENVGRVLEGSLSTHGEASRCFIDNRGGLVEVAMVFDCRHQSVSVEVR